MPHKTSLSQKKYTIKIINSTTPKMQQGKEVYTAAPLILHEKTIPKAEKADHTTKETQRCSEIDTSRVESFK